METQNKKPIGFKFIGDMRLNMTGPALAWLVTKSEKAYDGKFDMIQTVARCDTWISICCEWQGCPPAPAPHSSPQSPARQLWPLRAS